MPLTRLAMRGAAALALAVALLPPASRAACRVAWIDAGPSGSLAGDDEGVTWGWGEPQPLRLGITGPEEIVGLSGATSAALGQAHGLALLADGTVLGWGRNDGGALGPSVPAGAATAPVTLQGSTTEPLAGIAAVAAGASHSLALRSDGTVLAWGLDVAGQLGRTATTIGDADPGAVDGLPGIAATTIDAWGDRSMALLADGSVWSWGEGALGELGDGSGAGSDVPVRASGLPPATAIAAGRRHALALAADGSVWAWGWNGDGEVGAGARSPSVVSSPILVPGVSGAVAIAAGAGVSLAVRSDGTVVAWGDNAWGGLGPGGPRRSADPVAVPMFRPVVRLAAGGGHAVALLSDGSVRAWGRNDEGQLGSPPIATLRVPARVATPGPAEAIFGSRGDQSFARLRDGRIVAWGDDGAGELGLGLATASSPAPVEASPLAGLVAIASGGDHAVGVRADATLIAWGENASGQLGDGTHGPALVPVTVADAASCAAACAGVAHSLALHDDGSVFAWGDNALGQLGDASGSWDSALPVPVVGVGDATGVACGADHALAARAGGEVVAWGLNGAGQLGDGTLALAVAPVTVAGVSSPVALAAGRAHSLALLADGTVLAWGASDSGRLGVPSAGPMPVPAVVPGLPLDVVALAAGDEFSLALRADGSVLAWGATGLAQQDGRPLEEPFAVAGIPAATAIAAGAGHALALAGDGSVWAWGDARRGQCGTGAAAWSASPVDPGFGAGAGAVRRLLVFKDGDAVVLAWTREPSAASHVVRRSPTPLRRDFAIVASVTASSHVDTPPTADVWHYLVAVVDCSGAEGP